MDLIEFIECGSRKIDGVVHAVILAYDGSTFKWIVGVGEKSVRAFNRESQARKYFRKMTEK